MLKKRIVQQLSKDQIYNKLKYIYTKDVTSEILPDIRHS
jgi:hypothetical protein